MSSPTSNVAPFTRAVVSAMRSLYPESLADSSFDNTGLLLEAPYRRDNNLRNSALLTVDLTKAVADEAIARKDSVIVAYHPIIFRPLKSLTLANTQQNTLLRLAQEGISVYSPHTAVDAATGGLNDWLVDVLTTEIDPVMDKDPIDAHTSSVITPVANPPPNFENAGYGRILRFSEPQDLRTLITRARINLYGMAAPNATTSSVRLRGLSVATPQSVPVGQKGDIKITTVGICAGSGGSMLNGLDVDLLFTGELSHHEALAATEAGRCVITAFHSNTERGYLETKMSAKLFGEVEKTIADLVAANSWEGMETEFDIDVSRSDRDPFEVKTDENLDGW